MLVSLTSGLRRSVCVPRNMARILSAHEASVIFKATGIAIQILLGHSKIENTVRYLGVDVEDALLLAGRTEI